MTATPIVRQMRFEARVAMVAAMQMLEGRPGLTKDEQIQRLEYAEAALQEAQVQVIKARQAVEARDNDAHILGKAAAGLEIQP